MTIVPLGDAALLVQLGPTVDTTALDRVQRLAGDWRAAALPGVRDIVPAYTTIGVFIDEQALATGRTSLAEIAAKLQESGDRPTRSRRAPVARERIVPVCYGGEFGPDLEVVATRCGLSPREAVRLHCGAIYRVAAVGFSPGFPYLWGLPAALRTPRRETPRTHVPAGSVALGGAQAGIYPSDSPGGWHVIGRTPQVLFDPMVEPPSWLQPGDRVRFKPVDETALEPPPPRAVEYEMERFDVEVIQPGLLTSLQDLGRWGYQSQGVSPGGVMDEPAARLANLLVGNAEDAPVLEISLRGPTLRFASDTRIAVTGASIGGVAGGRVRVVKAGECIAFTDFTVGVRAFLAVAGGWKARRVLGGFGTALRAGFGGWRGRALRAGDRLSIGPAGKGPEAGRWFVPAAREQNETCQLRVIRGPQWSWFDETARREFFTAEYTVDSKSDRMGLRLKGTKLALQVSREMLSEPVANGSIQVPSDGLPIVLAVDRQTLGGYPKIANTIGVDLPRLAQLPAGSKVRFVEVSMAEAQRLRVQAAHDFAILRAGLTAKVP